MCGAYSAGRDKPIAIPASHAGSTAALAAVRAWVNPAARNGYGPAGATCERDGQPFERRNMRPEPPILRASIL